MTEKALNTKDYSPNDFEVATLFKEEGFKAKLREVLYPVLTYVRDKQLSTIYNFKNELPIDKLYWGQRGTDYPALRRLVNQHVDLKGKRILIIGCGLGKDLESWLPYLPKSVVGVDFLNYQSAWNKVTQHLKQKYPHTKISFVQADILKLNQFHDEMFDLIASDAVLEHVNQFDKALNELRRVLKNEGHFYANWGPLWHAWGGDHYSGTKGLAHGYDHLLLDKKDYEKSIDLKNLDLESGHDERIWYAYNLFSFLKPEEYLSFFDKHHFEKVYCSAMIDPRAKWFSDKYKEPFAFLRKSYSLMALYISGMTYLGKKCSVCS